MELLALFVQAQAWMRSVNQKRSEGRAEVCANKARTCRPKSLPKGLWLPSLWSHIPKRATVSKISSMPQIDTVSAVYHGIP